MDPITASIVGALTVGALQGLTELGKTAIAESYTQLKRLLHKKFGATSNVMQAVTQLEQKPTSSHRQGVLQEELAGVNALQDTELVTAARQLQMTIRQYQSISLHGSPVQGSIYQAGRDQYQIGRDQYNYNVHAGTIVGPGAKRTARNISSILLIIFGLTTAIPAVGILPFFDSIVNAMQPQPGFPDVPGAVSFTAAANSFGTAAHVMVYTLIGLGILMVIIGVWLRVGLKTKQH